MSLTRLTITTLIILSSHFCGAQSDSIFQLFQNPPKITANITTTTKAEKALLFSLPKNLLFKTAEIVLTDSGIYITHFTKAACKNYFSETIFYPNPTITIIPVKVDVTKPVPVEPRKINMLSIHGNISYDFFYRSAIDTPIAQRDFQQHTERVYLDILIKEKYPLKVNFIARQSNSPLFRNFFDPNIQFDRFAYMKNAKQLLINKVNSELPEFEDLRLIEAALIEEMQRYTALKKKFENQTSLQKIIEQREKGIDNKALRKNSSNKKKPGIDSLLSAKDSLARLQQSVRSKIDTGIQNLNALYLKEKMLFDSLAKKVNLLRAKSDSLKTTIQQKIITARQKINKASSQKELLKIASAFGVKPENRDKFESRLAAVKNFNIGRSIVNYSELTAQNITITGINIEYNPSYYAAITAGKIDYRFRDFYNRGSDRNKRNNQYLVMGRIRIGNINKLALIFSLFQGRKNTTEYSLSDTVRNYVNLMGYSIEAIYVKNENTNISAEFAKSTKPVSGTIQSNKQTGVLWNYADRSNMGINIKAQTMIPQTNTRLSGFYRKTGENFQSFSLFSYNTNQTAWLARFDQAFLKNKITLSGMLRRNDFTNPFTDKTFKTSTIFKSVLIHVRFPKYPALSIGYYPGTQLFIVNKDRIRENAYYVLNGSLTYSYFLKKRGMNTTIVYNRYTNQATDSGFALYKGVNYYAAQSVFFKKLNIQGAYAYTKQPELEFYTLETSCDYSFKRALRFGAGVKYNKVTSGNSYWGERIQLTLDLKRLGQLQMQYEKSYLPTISQTLYPVETGRVSYYINF